MRSKNAVSRFALAALVASSAAFAPQAAMAQPAAAPASAAQPSVAQFARNAPVMATGEQGQATADPARWGLAAADLSLLDDPALLRKAGLPGRAAAVAKAAAADDPIALYLHAVYLRGQGKNAAASADGFMLRASQLGLARAMSFVASGSYIAADTAEKQKPHLEILSGAAGLGNAFSTYMYGQAMLLSKVGGPASRGEGIQAMGFAAEAGFAPAQLWYAKMAFQAIDQGEKDPDVAKRAREMLDKAVAQGNADAIAFARERAAKK